MENDRFVVRGIEDKRKLLGFFAAKNHLNLVLRMADLRDLPIAAQHTLAFILRRYCGLLWNDAQEPVEFFMRNSFDGYLVVKFEDVLKAEMHDIRELQHVLYLYKEVRMGKGEPSRVEPCECVPLATTAMCQKCNGAGTTTTYLEMADEECQLAEAKR